MHNKVYKIEIVSAEEDENEIVDIIKKNGTTGKSRVALIYTIEVKRSVSIRSGGEVEEIL